MKKAFWISYDLGLKGDYAGLYTWLDSVGAKECGDSIAFFTMEIAGGSLDSIKKEIKDSVKLSKTDRIYLIFQEEGTNKTKGKFLFGGRKRAPWEGYAKPEGVVEDSA
ncbi:MAG: hypothetical protein IT279_08310 [Ignavibacteriaceae bacterium]|nr:hypothetical protein [Ignavibacteriaceae bacterium]